MKISVIGAGNVGSLSAMLIAQEELGEVILFDIIKGLSQGRACDIQDARAIIKRNYNIRGTDDITETASSDIIIITAGLARKPGMSREDLLVKNAEILKGTALNIKQYSPGSVVVVVTNPLDIMTYLVLKITGFPKHKVLGMGITLDASRFANLISQELDIPAREIDACVIGSHGESMLLIPRLTKIRGAALITQASAEKINYLISRTIKRGAEIVSLLGNGSAFFAPACAIAEIAKSIAKDQKRKLGVSVYLNGEYGINGLCLGTPCIIGRGGIEKIIQLDLTPEEKTGLLKSVEATRNSLETLNQFLS